MEIKSTLELRNNRAVVSIYVGDFTGSEMDKIYQYGSFVVEVGGTIAGYYEGEYISFVLPTQQRRVVDGFPVTRFFDLEDYADAEKRAYVYSRVIESRIRAERAKWMERATALPGSRTYAVTETSAKLPEYQSESGAEILTIDLEAHTFVLSTAFAVPPNQFILRVTNIADVAPAAVTASVQVYNLETQTLTVALTPAPPTGNYVLEYTVSVI